MAKIFVQGANYNKKRQKTLTEFGNNTKTEYWYDLNTYRLTRLKTTKNNSTNSLQDLNYIYDAVGNIVEINDLAQETSYYNNFPVEPRHLFTYDALYRILTGTGRELIGLAKATAGGYSADSLNAADTQAVHKYTQHFEYDKLGNILTLQHVTPTPSLNWTRAYVYETATNRLLKHDTSQTLPDYSYDAHGNMLTMPHLSNMVWDFNNRLFNTGNGTFSEFYNYDATGKRARKTTEKTNVLEERYYIGNYEVYRKFENGNLILERSTIHLMADTQRIATIDKETGGATLVRYQYCDHLGSACLEINENAAIISYEEFHPFGTTSYYKQNSSISQKRYRYVGKERDEETGLYYYGARYYAAWIARFVSVDPLQHKYPELTPFQYASNNPVTMIDIDGMEGGKPEEKQLVQEQMEKRDVTNIDSAKEPVVPELKDKLKNREQEMVQKVTSALNESMSAAGILQGGAESVAKSLDKNMLMGADNMLYLKNQDPRLKSLGDRALMTDDVTKLKSTGRNIRMTNDLGNLKNSISNIGIGIDIFQIAGAGLESILAKGENREAAIQNLIQNTISFVAGEVNPAFGVIVDIGSSIVESKEFKETKLKEYESKMNESKNTDSKKYENAKANYLKYNQLLNGNTNPEQKQVYFKQGK